MSKSSTKVQKTPINFVHKLLELSTFMAKQTKVVNSDADQQNKKSKKKIQKISKNIESKLYKLQNNK